MVYDTAANVRVRARAAAIEGVCAQLARRFSSSGEYWTTRYQPIDTTGDNWVDSRGRCNTSIVEVSDGDDAGAAA
jgi:hypothetical protein